MFTLETDFQPIQPLADLQFQVLVNYNERGKNFYPTITYDLLIYFLITSHIKMMHTFYQHKKKMTTRSSSYNEFGGLGFGKVEKDVKERK